MSQSKNGQITEDKSKVVGRHNRREESREILAPRAVSAIATYGQQDYVEEYVVTIYVRDRIND